MFLTYILIGVTLVVIGIVSSVYFIRLLKSGYLPNVTVTALSESLSTIFIGIFYFYCAIILSQHILNPSTKPVSGEDDTTIIQENEDTTEAVIEYEESTTEEIEVTTLPIPSVNNKYHIDEAFLNYQNTFKNILRRNITFINNKEVRNLKFRQNSPENNTFFHYEGDDCFDKIFMENSMFLYSFLHSVLSLIINAVKPPEEEQTLSKQKVNKTESDNSETENTNKTGKLDKYKLVLKILVTWLIPILFIVALYFAMDHNVESDFTKLFNVSGVDFNILNIIENPINVTTTEKKDEVDDIIQNIYRIVNGTQERGAAKEIEAYHIDTKRRPKELVDCSNYNNLYRFYVFTVFLLYIVAIFYMKIKETRMRSYDVKTARRLNISIASFAALWFLSILEMFSKTYLFSTSTSSVLSDVFLTLGNLNQLSIIVINCLTTKEMMKKYNLVEPKA